MLQGLRQYWWHFKNLCWCMVLYESNMSKKGVFAVWGYIKCKCKCKCWFVFYAFLWTCQETDYFRLSYKLVGWLTIDKSKALEIVYCTHAGAVKGVVGEGKSVSWGVAKPKVMCTSPNSPKICSCTVICWSCVGRKTQHHWVLPWHNFALWLENSRCKVTGKKDRELLTNQIIIYTSSTHVKPYQNIFEHFWTNLKFW